MHPHTACERKNSRWIGRRRGGMALGRSDGAGSRRRLHRAQGEEEARRKARMGEGGGIGG